ncbi:unnamed protein product [Effrenium voratum]|nr:unnamed protein product [Effrenium voratum]
MLSLPCPSPQVLPLTPRSDVVEKLVRFLHLKAETQQADKAQALLWRCAAEGRAVHPFGALSAAEVRRAIAKFEQKKEPKEDAPVEAPKDVLSLSRGKARPQVVKDLALYLRSQTPKRRCNSEQMLRVAAERRWQVAGLEMPSAESSLLPRDLSEVQKDIEASTASSATMRWKRRSSWAARRRRLSTRRCQQKRRVPPALGVYLWRTSGRR